MLSVDIKWCWGWCLEGLVSSSGLVCCQRCVGPIICPFCFGSSQTTPFLIYEEALMFLGYNHLFCLCMSRNPVGHDETEHLKVHCCLFQGALKLSWSDFSKLLKPAVDEAAENLLFFLACLFPHWRLFDTVCFKLFQVFTTCRLTWCQTTSSHWAEMIDRLLCL